MIVASCINGMYVITAETCNRKLALKFDTGAQSTVISIDRLYKDLCDKQIQVIRDKLKGCRLREFKAADGGMIQGVLCHVSNFMLGTAIIPKFYFNLVLCKEVLL